LLRRTWLGLPIRRLSFIGTGPADYGGFLVERDDEGVIEAMVTALASAKCDLIDLHQLAEPVALRVLEALKNRMNVEVLPQEPTFSVELVTEYDAYLSTLSKKFRTNTVYAGRRLRRDFVYEDRAYGQGPEVADGMELFFKLHQQRWLSKRLPGLFFSADNRRFHLDLAGRLAAADRLILNIVSIDGRPASALYGFKYAGTYSYYLGGFDPDFAKYSVSSVLIFDLIDKATSERATSFDFLRGEEPYKLRWGATGNPRFRLVAWRSTARGRLGAGVAARHNAFVQRARARLHK